MQLKAFISLIYINVLHSDCYLFFLIVKFQFYGKKFTYFNSFMKEAPII